MALKIYTLPTCLPSEKLRKFLKSKKIKFEEISLFKNEPARLEVIELTGQLATPVIQIDEEILIGFDEATLKPLLPKNPKNTKNPQSKALPKPKKKR